MVEYRDPRVFLKRTQPYFSNSESLYSLFQGLLLMVGDFFPQENVRMLEFEDTFLLQTMPDKPFILLNYSPALRDKIQKALPENCEVVGPKADIENLLEGESFKVIMQQKIYQLETVIMPAITSELKLAGPEHLDLLADWMCKFQIDTGINLSPNQEETFSSTRERLKREQVYLLFNEATPVATVGWARPTLNGVTVNGVYTPEHFRKKGYASQAVALLSKQLLNHYKFCTLYTDALYPTSNKIYQKVGYEFIDDSLHVERIKS